MDAHEGTVLFHYIASPLLDIPSKCTGIDELDEDMEFWGRQVESGFEMYDPMRLVKTSDHGLNDFERDPLPQEAVQSQSSDFGTAHKAAVSAHVNASVVDNFLRSVLMRDGIDDKGMNLESIVNVTVAIHMDHHRRQSKQVSTSHPFAQSATSTVTVSTEAVSVIVKITCAFVN